MRIAGNTNSNLFGRSATVAALCIGGLVSTISAADAQPPNRARRAEQRQNRPSEQFREQAERFQARRVSETLRHKVDRATEGEGETPIMGVHKRKVSNYTDALENSVEVLFNAEASDYGHILVRVGDRVYDMPNPRGARDRDATRAIRRDVSGGWFDNKRSMYGFVFEVSNEKVGILQQAFEELINRDPGFSITGRGPEDYSCAGFCTSVLSEHAPELNVRLTAGAKGAGRSLLRRGNFDAITLYGKAAENSGSDDFTFKKLERN